MYTRFAAGTALTLAMASSLLGAGSASAQTITVTASSATVSSAVQLSSDGSTAVTSGTMLTFDATGYGADEPVGFWINVPAGTTVSSDSLGQTDSLVDGTVIGLDSMANTDDYGAFTYSFDTSGLPAGTYTLVAHGLNTGTETVYSFTIQPGSTSTVRLTTSGDTTVAAGTMLTLTGISYQVDEPIGFWINVPAGTSVSSDSLGQTDSVIDGSVIPLDAMANTGAKGDFTYDLNTTGLPAGNYSIVAHGLNSNIDSVLLFTIK